MTGSYPMKSGIEHNGIFYRANTAKFHSKVRVSVNRSPFVITDPTELILLSPSYTYSVEKDTVITLYHTVNVNGEIVQDKQCIGDHALVKNVESGTVCSMVLDDDITANKGNFAGVLYVTNEFTQTANCEIKFYYDGTEVDTHTVEVAKRTTKAVSVSGKIATSWTKGKEVKISVTVNKADQHIYGAVNPSVIRVEKQP